MLSKKSNKESKKLSRIITLFVVAIIGSLVLSYSLSSESQGEHRTSSNAIKQKTVIGILMPMDHAALREIVAGFKDKVTEKLGDTVEIKVQNSQGDMNLQRSILQQFLRQKVDIVVPIGTAATQLTVSMVHETPIVSLAANFAMDARSKLGITNVTGVIDEIGPEKPMQLLKSLKPNLKKITLIYSNSEKVFPEVEDAIAYGEKQGIKIQKLMIQALPELYTVSRLIDPDSEAIFILKDHLIVSGIQTLAKEAEKRGILIMAADEGSVQGGATLALGVSERSIGEQGGNLASRILSGESLAELPVQKIKDLAIFYNQNAMETLGLDLKQLEVLGKDLGFSLEKMQQMMPQATPEASLQVKK